MAYSKQRPTWVDYPDESTLIRAQDLNGIEEGISQAHTTADGAAQKSANLSDLASAATARTNLGLGTAATADTGTGAGNVILGNDSRLTDARTPTAHTHVATAISDSTAVGRSLLTAADAAAARTATGAAAASHTHAAADIASGTLAPARIGSGTAAAGKYVDGGTGAWTTLPAGGGLSFGYQKLSAGSAVRMYDANRVDTNAFNTLSRLTFAPFYMAYGSNLLRHFYVNVGTTAATSVIRLGIYSAGSDGMPGALVVDLGTVSGSAATGDVILSRSAGTEIQLAPGLYFLAAVIQTAACTVARYVSTFTAFGTGIYGESPLVGTGAANNATIPYQDSVTGALPATPTISGISNTGIFMTARVQ